MRTRFVEHCTTALVIIVGSCRFSSASPATCDDDPELCPPSSRKAMSVTCDCQCTIGAGDDARNRFAGRVAVCLPAALNTWTASEEQRVALVAMKPRVFDPRIFQHCSTAVAGFVALPSRVTRTWRSRRA